MSYDQLKLKNQLCFPVYAASRLITREYQPYLDALGLTYPQYLVLLILWEHRQMPVNDIAKLLILNTNTVTPLLKRMEAMQLITRTKSKDDERSVIVRLAPKAEQLQESAANIPAQLSQKLLNASFEVSQLVALKSELDKIIEVLTDEEKTEK